MYLGRADMLCPFVIGRFGPEAPIVLRAVELLSPRRIELMAVHIYVGARRASI
jgi:hypothetical protein